MYDKEFNNISWLFGHPDNPEWLKNKNSESTKFYKNTNITPDLIWDERTPLI